MPHVTNDDKAVAAIIYGKYRDLISIKCIGCIAEEIAVYREKIMRDCSINSGQKELVAFCLGRQEDVYE